MELGDQLPLAVGDEHSDGHHLLAQHVVDGAQQIIHPLAGQGADGHRVGVVGQGLLQLAPGLGIRPIQPVDLVQGSDHRLVPCPQLLQHLLHRGHLLVAVVVGDVHHVEEQVRLVDLLQRGPEGGHQGGGQLLDEAHRVGEEGLPSAGQGHPAGGGVQGGEELVLGHHLGVADGVEQGALAGVGVAHQGDDRHRIAPSALPVLLPVFVDLGQLLLQVGDAPPDLPSVHLQLGLARAADAHAAGGAPGPSTRLPGQVGPGSGQAGEPVLVLGQLHLDCALPGAGVAGEDVQDERGAVDDLHILSQGLLQLPLLPRRELLVEDHHVRARLLDQALELLQLALADEGGRVGVIQPLGQLAHHLQAGGLGQEAQLGQGVLHAQEAGLAGQLHPHQHGQLLGPLGAEQARSVPLQTGALPGRAGAVVVHLGDGGSILAVFVGHGRFLGKRGAGRGQAHAWSLLAGDSGRMAAWGDARGSRRRRLRRGVRPAPGGRARGR